MAHKAPGKSSREEKILLPTTKEVKPDWQFMEDYIKSLSYSSSL